MPLIYNAISGASTELTFPVSGSPSDVRIALVAAVPSLFHFPEERQVVPLQERIILQNKDGSSISEDAVLTSTELQYAVQCVPCEIAWRSHTDEHESIRDSFQDGGDFSRASFECYPPASAVDRDVLKICIRVALEVDWSSSVFDDLETSCRSRASASALAGVYPVPGVFPISVDRSPHLPFEYSGMRGMLQYFDTAVLAQNPERRTRDSLENFAQVLTFMYGGAEAEERGDVEIRTWVNGIWTDDMSLPEYFEESGGERFDLYSFANRRIGYVGVLCGTLID